MMPAGLPPWQWRARASDEEPLAAVAWGDAAARLHAQLARDAATSSGRWCATASRDVLVVQGEPATLPWVDGVAYAAPCRDAPALWLPTLWEPDLPGDLVARALQRLHGRQPLLLWPQPLAVVPMDRLLPVTPALLARIADHWQDHAT
ncbi:MAG TPA: hypothetical protein VFL86_24805 [Burkholderiaceae bacterium]|nr:hypothetical protein [Burkholderiaceae bacterium]